MGPDGEDPAVTALDRDGAGANRPWCDLAEAAGLHPKAVAYWEAKTAIRGRGEEVGVGRIRAAFEAAGVSTFVNPSPGVRIIARR